MGGHQNLIMPTEGSGYPDSLGTLTVWGILKESARVIQKHVRLLLPFVLTFTVPVSIYVAISWGSKFPYTIDISPAIIHARSLMQTSFTVTAIQRVTIVPVFIFGCWQICLKQSLVVQELDNTELNPLLSL
jgi:4-amino-4-deoxy-L-arabinose transferase-like glycosyltransferase